MLLLLLSKGLSFTGGNFKTITFNKLSLIILPEIFNKMAAFPHESQNL